jgi:signal transduction histidine kinase
VRDPEEGLTGRPPAPGLWARLGHRLARFASGVGLERSARLLSVATVPLLAAGGDFDDLAPVFSALAAYVLVTAFVPRNRWIRAADLLVAAALIALTHGQIVPFLFFLIVAVAGPASAGGVRAGLAAGGTLSAVLLTTLGWSGELPALGLGGALPAALLFPLAGVTAASAAQVLADQSVQGRLVLEEANRLLSSLRSIADDIPGGLDVSTVSAAILAELRTVAGGGAAIVYAEQQGLLQPTAAAGVSPGQVPTLRLDELRGLAAVTGTSTGLHTPRDLPAALRPAARVHPHWSVVALEGEESPVGVLLVGFDAPDAAVSAGARLGSIASDGGLALDNARLFYSTRARTADAARRSIAGDLHDGVAQSLAHIRMELELLARHSDGPMETEARRLAQVAGAALEDLRATIRGLRKPLDGGLATMIATHIDGVRSPSGPDLTFQVAGTAELAPERRDEVLKVAQEAVSNALRHARAASVTVGLDLSADELVLRVEDDGIGVNGRTVRPGTGIGLRSMRERAERLGGDLAIRERLGSGTEVVLRCPVEGPASPPRRSDHLTARESET